MKLGPPSCEDGGPSCCAQNVIGLTFSQDPSRRCLNSASMVTWAASGADAPPEWVREGTRRYAADPVPRVRMKLRTALTEK